MDGSNLVPAAFGSVVEGVSGNTYTVSMSFPELLENKRILTFRGLSGDKLNRLNDTIDDLSAW